VSQVIKIEIIKSSFSNLLILSYKTYILKEILNKVNNISKKDLILNNIVIIKRFYINIVFKAKLLLINI
jgi:ketopantoate reductase